MNNFQDILFANNVNCYVCDKKADIWAIMIDTIDVNSDTRTFDNGYGLKQVVTGKQKIYTKGQIVPCCREHARNYQLLIIPSHLLDEVKSEIKLSEIMNENYRKIRFEGDNFDGRS